ncbi:MAG: chemotaxis protein CheW [Candidatus Auribacterota bacterium]|jgi:purine-binding chemotaxis protein CheW|nr:chemotaxis protein CheW [Candidatus Auribacterota bacterium]
MAKVDTERELQLVTFRLGKEEYGVNIEQVREIIRIVEIIHVPKAPAFVEGLINLRGTVVSVIDLRKRFDIVPSGEKEAERIIVVEVQNRTIGVIVDSVLEVLRLSSSNIDDVPPTVSGVDTKFLFGVGKIGERLMMLLDLDKVLSTEELKGLENLKQQSNKTAKV